MSPVDEMGFRILGEELISQDITVRRRLGKSGGGGIALFTISGTVYDADGTTAVSGATIALGALTATSGADGTYTISNVPAGTSGSMTCTKAGYSWTAITVAAMSGDLTGQDYTNAWWAGGGCAALCVGAYKSTGAASLAASYVNLKNPGTNDLTAPVAAPTWDAVNGWKFDGISQYLATGLVPANDQTWSMVVSFSGYTPTSDMTFAGLYHGTTRQFRLGHAANVIYANGQSAVIAPTMDCGVIAVAGNKAYRSGVVEASTLGAYGGGVTFDIYIGCAHLSTPSNYFDGYVCAVAVYSTTPLTGQQVAMISGVI